MINQPKPMLIVVLKDGSIEKIQFRNLHWARRAAHQLNQGAAYRAAFAMLAY